MSRTDLTFNQTNIPCLHCSCLPVSNSRLSANDGTIDIVVIVVVTLGSLVVVDPEIYSDIDPLIVDIDCGSLEILPEAV